MREAEHKHRPEIAGVQYLRALAALFVVYFHTSVYDAQFNWPSEVPRGFGAGGVDMFFVISGFIMMLVTSMRPTSPAMFLLRRVARIAPLYWGITLTVAILCLIYPAAMLENVVTAPHLVMSVLFFPHTNPLSISISPFYKIGWTLNYEMYFYFIFALCLTLRSPAKRLILLAGYAVFVSAIFLITDPQVVAARVYTNPIVLEFVLGAAVGHLHVTGRLARLGGATSWCCCGLGLTALVTFPVDDATRVILQGVPSAALLSGILGLEVHNKLPRVGWLLLLGDASYSIYLMHPLVESFFRLATKAGHISVGSSTVGPAAAVLAVAVSAFVGVAVYRVIELPLLRVLMSRIALLPGSAAQRRTMPPLPAPHLNADLDNRLERVL